MRESNFNRKNVPAIDKMLTQMEQMSLPQREDNDVVRCDLCAEPVYPNRYTESYIANLELVSGARQLGIQRLYCEDCAVGTVKYPCYGVLEIIVSGSFDRNRQYQDLELEDYSIPDDGDKWSPVEVSEEVFKMPIEAHAQMTGGMQIGPEDIVDALNDIGIDIRDILDDEGNVAMDEETEAMVLEKMMDKADEYLEDPDKLRRVSKVWDEDM